MVQLGALAAIASGIAVAVLGLSLLTVRPRTTTLVAFVVAALLWGSSVFAANLARLLTDASTTLALVHLSLVLLIPLYIPLIIFTLRATGRPDVLARPTALAVLALPALAALLLYAAAPGIFLDSVVTTSGGRQTVAGPGAALGTINSSLVFAVCLFLAIRTPRAVATTTASRSGLVVAALTVYVSYRAAQSLFLVGDALRFVGDSTFLEGVRLVSGWACVAAAGLAAWTAFRDRTLPWRDLILACAIAPFLVGAGEIGMLAAGLPAVDTVGLWRLALVGIFAYAIVRYNLFDIEVKMRAASAPVAYAVVASAALLALWGLFGDALLSSPMLGGAATLGVGLMCVPAARLGPYFVDRAAPQVRDPEYLYKRKVDVYRAALEESESSDMGQRTEELFLSDLRRRLGISEDEHRILLLVVRSQSKYSRPPPVAPPSSTAASKYEILREIGRGAAGRVVLAKDKALDREVVLKQPLAPWLLDEQGRQLFLQEARLAARVRHPNVVAVYDVLMDAEPPLIAMEHVQGGSLEKRLDPARRLAPAEALRVTLDVLDGLAAVHAAGIVHRDLKPSNVLLEPDGRAKVGDFGIARPPMSHALAATLSGTSGQPGSIAYMSPEQARGDDVDARTDLYACGAMLYRMLTGQHYVELARASEARARDLVATAPPRLPHPAAPSTLEPLLRRALAKEPAARYQSAAEMAAALRAASAAGAAAREPRGVDIPIRVADVEAALREPRRPQG